MIADTLVAKANYILISPFKVRRVAKLVRNLTTSEALALLKNTNYSASTPLYKVISSAVANANDKGFKSSNYIITELLVNEGPRHKRHRPRARGRIDTYKRRTCHIIVRIKGI
eukprot:COSAG01_NODE_1_length_100484_cov_170.446142_86_plen_113_part_00